MSGNSTIVSNMPFKNNFIGFLNLKKTDWIEDRAKMLLNDCFLWQFTFEYLFKQYQ